MSKNHMAKIEFKPKLLAKQLVSVLPARARDIVRKRYGLEGDERMTLEAIGEMYGITRERVRQIENFSLNAIKKSDAYRAAHPAFGELSALITDHGSVVSERHFFDQLTKDRNLENHLHFFLVLGDAFTRLKEDDEFHHRWTTDKDLSEKVHNAIRALYESLSEDDVVAESEIVSRFLEHLQHHVAEIRDAEKAKRWLGISKKIGKNPLGNWGIAHSPNVKIRGMRDLAYLVLREHGSPMHFEEVSKAIEKYFGRKAHVATCHNELIKDDRFVLVGRGLYALSSWGYSKGTVRDIITTILKKDGPLTKEEIVAKVLKERYVKENTIGVNLQNTTYFKRDAQGRYMIA